MSEVGATPCSVRTTTSSHPALRAHSVKRDAHLIDVDGHYLAAVITEHVELVERLVELLNVHGFVDVPDTAAEVDA